VVPAVYNEFKTYGGKSITSPSNEIIFLDDGFDFEIKDFDVTSFEKNNESLVVVAKHVIEKLITKDAFS
ncbi:hypothetical protein, partial [Propionibacterium freudenreichii]|uniref:hypothetical protein n=1 Tax=Propionibacterium freudenreichii TaxID=1744 RepID=UPI003851FFE9